MLEKISDIGMTIVTVIHQPRVEIFQRFDDVLLIAPGGRTAYLGSPMEARFYFENLGYNFPAGSNDADVLMDILSGLASNSVKNHSIDDLVEFWVKHYETLEHPVDTAEILQEDEDFHRLSAVLVKERGASFLAQVWFSHNLSLLQQYRKFSGLVMEICVAALAGVIMGVSLAAQPETYKGVYVTPYTFLSPAPNLWLTVQLSLLVGLAVALAASPSGVKVFSEELHVYWRNAASGHSPLAYFVAKSSSAMYRMVLAALHFSSILYYLSTPIIPFWVRLKSLT